MASEGPNNPGTVVDDAAVGTLAWINPDNAKVSDNSYSTAGTAAPPNKYTHYLKATNFGFSIPIGATINGIIVEIERKSDIVNGVYCQDYEVKIVKADGSIGAENKAKAEKWPITEAYFSYGANNDLWSEVWTAANINDVDFGVVLQAFITAPEPVCLNENSLISTPKGYVKIKDVKIGDEVLSYNEKTKSIVSKKINMLHQSAISNYGNKYYFIYCNEKLIKCTRNHPFFINGKYVKADKIKLGDKLLFSNLQEYPVEKIEIKENKKDIVWDLTVQDYSNFFVDGFLCHNHPTTASVDHIRITVYYTEIAVGTNMKVNISDVFKDISEIKVNIGDVWKDVTKIQINIGDVWKTVFE